MNTNCIIAEMPEELRPYEKCEALGAEFLSDPELLAVLIRTGTGGSSAVKLAECLLYPDGGARIGLNAIMHYSMEQFMSVRGIGRVKAIQLSCVAELCRRMAKEKALEQPRFTDPDSVAAYYMQQLRTLSEEEVHIMLLDTKKSFIRSILVSRGTVNCSAISPREIFIKAVSFNAASFIVVHNHPSGDPSPSGADIRFTRLLKELGEMMNIPLTDSVIIGDNSYTSILEKGLIQ